MAAHLIRRLTHKTPIWLLKLMGNFWLPFWGAGIRVMEVSPDYLQITVRLKRSWFNRNYVGTQFGGSIYAMTDPFYMMMLINNLGPNYIVWDKSAQIDFLKPGRSELTAKFALNHELLDHVRAATSTGDRYIFDLPVEVKDADQVIVARVRKTLYVRKKS